MSSALRPENLLGALWSSTELTIDPQQVIASLPKFLASSYRVQFRFNTAVTRVESGALNAGGEQWEANSIIIASGDDFQTLFPEYCERIAVTRCKLQMMRTLPQPRGWSLGPSLAFGLTFRHYPTFEVCASLQALKERIARETPELEKWEST